MNYLVDTCVISEFTRKAPSGRVLKYLNNLNEMDVAISVITIGEIKNGIECVKERKKREVLADWFSDGLLARFKNRTIAIDSGTMVEWGIMTAALKGRGIALPVMDSLIAAQCRQHNLCLITRNVKDFKPADISIVNPWDIRKMD